MPSSQEDYYSPWKDFFRDFLKKAERHDWSDRKLSSKMQMALEGNDFYLDIDGQWVHAQHILDDLRKTSAENKQLNALRREKDAQIVMLQEQMHLFHVKTCEEKKQLGTACQEKDAQIVMLEEKINFLLDRTSIRSKPSVKTQSVQTFGPLSPTHRAVQVCPSTSDKEQQTTAMPMKDASQQVSVKQHDASQQASVKQHDASEQVSVERKDDFTNTDACSFLVIEPDSDTSDRHLDSSDVTEKKNVQAPPCSTPRKVLGCYSADGESLMSLITSSSGYCSHLGDGIDFPVDIQDNSNIGTDVPISVDISTQVDIPDAGNERPLSADVSIQVNMPEVVSISSRDEDLTLENAFLRNELESTKADVDFIRQELERMCQEKKSLEDSCQTYQYRILSYTDDLREKNAELEMLKADLDAYHKQCDIRKDGSEITDAESTVPEKGEEEKGDEDSNDLHDSHQTVRVTEVSRSPFNHAVSQDNVDPLISVCDVQRKSTSLPDLTSYQGFVDVSNTLTRFASSDVLNGLQKSPSSPDSENHGGTAHKDDRPFEQVVSQLHGFDAGDSIYLGLSSAPPYNAMFLEGNTIVYKPPSPLKLPCKESDIHVDVCPFPSDDPDEMASVHGESDSQNISQDSEKIETNLPEQQIDLCQPLETQALDGDIDDDDSLLSAERNVRSLSNDGLPEVNTLSHEGSSSPEEPVLDCRTDSITLNN